MQTFLPFPDFAASAAVLDRQRLGKQRVEVVQILRVLAGESPGWRSHPVVKAWAPFAPALRRYGIAVCEEWLSRGYKDTCFGKIEWSGVQTGPLPPWLTEELCAQYRGVLLRKDASHYGRFGWTEEAREAIDYELLDLEATR